MNRALLSSRNMDWRTPDDFFAELDREFHFDLDAAASDGNAKCAHYFTPEDDGLRQDWSGHTVFCNPPYGREVGKWVEKAYRESRRPGTAVVMLIPARTDTAYFHEYIFGGRADEIRFLRGRLHFSGGGRGHREQRTLPIGGHCLAQPGQKEMGVRKISGRRQKQCTQS